MLSDYDLDRIVQFGTAAVDEEKQIVNPAYRKLTNNLKSLREKISRLEAKLYPVVDELVEAPLEKIVKLTTKQANIREKIGAVKDQETEMVAERKTQATHIAIKEMIPAKRLNKLKTESKLLFNIIKMIAYRAETAVATLLTPFVKQTSEEKRMLVKQIIQSSADLIPNKEKNTLTVRLHGLSAPRFNKAIKDLTEILAQTETIFPGTQIKLIYEIVSPSNYEG